MMVMMIMMMMMMMMMMMTMMMMTMMMMMMMMMTMITMTMMTMMMMICQGSCWVRPPRVSPWVVLGSQTFTADGSTSRQSPSCLYQSPFTTCRRTQRLNSTHPKPQGAPDRRTNIKKRRPDLKRRAFGVEPSVVVDVRHCWFGLSCRRPLQTKRIAELTVDLGRFSDFYSFR